MKLKHAIPAAFIALGLVAAASPAHAVTVKQVRQSDFIAALKDTRSAGHFEFLTEGLHVWTDDTSSQAKVAEYFPVTGALPSTSRWTGWSGSAPLRQPGVQIVFDVDATTGNGNDFNMLVGEPVYGVDGSGNVTDWWLTNGLQRRPAKAAAPPHDRRLRLGVARHRSRSGRPLCRPPGCSRAGSRSAAASRATA